VPWTPSLVPPRHSVANQGDLLRPLGIEFARRGDPPVEMPAEPHAVATVTERLTAAGVGHDTPLALIHVSASSPFRRWPAERFAELAAHLLREHPHLRVAFTAGPAEQPLQDHITTLAEQKAGLAAARIVHCGNVDLATLRALIDRASVYIGGDSGPLHIAATTATPIVALLGPTVAERSLPWRQPELPTIAVDVGPLPCRPCDQRHCAPGDFRCLTGIAVEQVATAASRLLQASR
jgi:heptosyltransferase III